METRVKPTARQLEYQQWEWGVFFHFGIRTFYEGWVDWDSRPMSPERFDPEALDCRQWIKTVADAGGRYAVLTAKHHDGFANWPSRHTAFSVASSPWRGGRGDVVAGFLDACREFGVKAGIYYSPADRDMTLRTGREHDDFFIQQISELLTGYGPVDMLWFDGCGSEGHEYDRRRIVGEIRRMQPEILVFNMWDPDYRWVGNEEGVAPSPCFNAAPWDDGGAKEIRWLPAECDCRIRGRNWFYSDNDAHELKSTAELAGLYELSVGRGANLLINIAPDRRGLIPEDDRARLLAFGAELRRRYSNPVPAVREDDGAGVTLFPQERALVDAAVLQEDLAGGESVRSFTLWGRLHRGGEEYVVYEGRSIGHKAICRFPPVRLAAVRLEVRECSGPARIASMSLHCTI